MAEEQVANPEAKNEPDDQALDRRNARAALGLFAVYLVFYAAFMALNIIDPAMMATQVAGGVNLAIVYGFGLIIAALVLALAYMAICRRNAGRGGAR